MLASGSHYRTISQSSGLFLPMAWRDLATRRLKQMWRNYELYLEAARATVGAEGWVEYCEKRYLL